jgi:hypothetical protein
MNNFRLSLLSGMALTALSFSSVSSAQAQQQYVSHYDAYVGFTDLNSPDLGLNQPGFHTQAGFNPRTWMSVGFDYSWSKGSEILTTGLLPTALQQQIGAAEAYYQSLGALPAGYRLAVPTDATTQTFAFGPQLRPSLGALRERAVPHPTDAFSTVIAAQLAPAGYKTDWTGFYGVGGGADYSLTKSFGLRMQLDAVHDHPFNDILANGRWTYRFAVGPSFHFGRNIVGETSHRH